MKFRDLIVAAPLALALTACGTSSGTSTTASTSSGLAGSSTVTSAPTSTGGGTTLTITGSSGSSGTTTVNGCPQYPTHPLYQYPNLQATGSGPVYTTPNDITADSKLRVSIIPGNANGTTGTGASANYNNLSADVHLISNGAELATFTIAGNGAQTQSYTFPTGIPVGKTSNPTLADFSSYLTGNQKYSIQVDNIKTDYKCNMYATFAYYQTMGDCYYYYNPGSSYQGTCSYNWNFDYHQNNWACCYTNMLEQTQQLQCGVGSPDSGASFSLTVKVETDSTPCITGT